MSIYLNKSLNTVIIKFGMSQKLTILKIVFNEFLSFINNFEN